MFLAQIRNHKSDITNGETPARSVDEFTNPRVPYSSGARSGIAVDQLQREFSQPGDAGDDVAFQWSVGGRRSFAREPARFDLQFFAPGPRGGWT